MKQEKVESILNTAGKMFARYGLRKTSIEEMARVARVAKATIYSYFGNKDQVYLKVLSQEKNEIVARESSWVDQEALPADKLVTFVKAKFKYMRQAKNILNLDREGIENLLPRAESIRNELFECEVDIIHSILKDGVEKGVFHINDFLLTARAIAHALRGFELNWLIQESEEKVGHYLDELISILFYGLMFEKKGGRIFALH
ncbi:MAG: TetR/AcrR family transcriptional regulator [Deltaproteobacteria bacterium]|nr:TetR/AcrR family transcriptional regulator [Deltaproteobacteria bacterium]